MSDLEREKRRKTKDWSELSEDLLAEISRRIIDYKDFVRFGLVCRSWKSAASMDDYYKARHRQSCAFLLLLCRRTPRLLYDLTSRQPCNDVNETVHKSFRQIGMFASLGWVVVETMSLKPLLLNPVDGTTIKLPDLRCARCYGKIRSFELRQAAISSDPSFTSDYTVILKASVSNDRDRSGVKSFLWQAGSGNLPGCNHPGWSVFPFLMSFNIASFRGLLGILLIDGSIQVRGPSTLQILSVPSAPYKLLRPGSPGDCYDHKFFVESQRGLLVIVQWLDRSSSQTKEFHVFELDWESKEWTQVEDLGCRALFLKPYQTPTLLDDCNRFLANKIYYLSSSSKVIRVKIYNLATKLFEPPLQIPRCHRACVPQTQWIFPTKKIKPDSQLGGIDIITNSSNLFNLRIHCVHH